MKEAGVDTEAVLHAGLVSFMEGAMLYGVFHGDLHGGNLIVRPDGRTVLMDFGITGRLDETKRLAFLMLLVGATSGDTMGQLRALRDLGAFPPDTDLDAVFTDLGLDRTIDPTMLSADELVHELQDLTKKLLEYGARAPKELMLFVKNMMFLDGAIARLAPDLDILEEIQRVHTEIAARHGVRLANELGIDPALTAAVRHGRGEGRDGRARRGDGSPTARCRNGATSFASAWRRSASARRLRSSVPELPQMQALAERIEEWLRGATFEGYVPLGFSGLKTAVPSPDELIGRTLSQVSAGAPST